MSFYSIPDPVERELVVEDYKRIKREIQERNENRKMSGQNRYRTLQETFSPVVKAQTDMADKIVNSLKEIRPVKEQQQQEKVLKPSKKRRLSSDEYGSIADAYRNRYMSRDGEIDTSFGITFRDGMPYIANTPITIDHDDITIYDKVYDGTPGLWNLITERTKGLLEGKYTDDDLTAYESILRQTNALHKDYDPNSKYPKSSASWKWRSILSPIWEKYRKENDEVGEGLIFNRRIGKRSGKGFRTLRNGIYSRKGQVYKL